MSSFTPKLSKQTYCEFYLYRLPQASWRRVFTAPTIPTTPPSTPTSTLHTDCILVSADQHVLIITPTTPAPRPHLNRLSPNDISRCGDIGTLPPPPPSKSIHPRMLTHRPLLSFSLSFSLTHFATSLPHHCILCPSVFLFVCMFVSVSLSVRLSVSLSRLHSPFSVPPFPLLSLPIFP